LQAAAGEVQKWQKYVTFAISTYLLLPGQPCCAVMYGINQDPAAKNASRIACFAKKACRGNSSVFFHVV
jgi:hypothetical protein